MHSPSNITFVLLSAGEYVMGSPDSEAGHQPDETRHRVRVSRSFYISIHEITRRQWSTVMPVEPIGIPAGGQDSPVVNVSWFELRDFVDRMNRLGREAFRLPTEVGSFAPNAWGLFDMHGNAWEWTSDGYCSYGGDATDPHATCNGPLKVIRGGSWRFNAESARCALRYTHNPQDRGDSLGFRLVRVVEYSVNSFQFPVTAKGNTKHAKSTKKFFTPLFRVLRDLRVAFSPPFRLSQWHDQIHARILAGFRFTRSQCHGLIRTGAG